MIRGFVLAGLLALAAVRPVSAQDATLDSVERLAASGRLTDARATLERWNQEHPENAAVSGAVRAQALLLAARLAVDPGAAEQGYLAVALGYPTTPQAPEALLRLGQGLVLAAEAGTRADGATRATGFLERLVNDYPGSEHRPTGLLWLVRAHALAGRADRACATARAALDAGIDDDDVADMLRVEMASRCHDVTPVPSGTSPQTSPPPLPATGRFTVQSAALADERRADGLASALRTAGFDARVVRVPGSRLVRVRVGRFEDAKGAEAMAARMRAAHFDAAVVGDAQSEVAR